MHKHTAWPTCLADRDRDCDRSGELSITARGVTQRGIPLSDIEDMGGVLYSYFSDPDGNMWALQQWPAGYQS
jgi:N6-adenosine-specific RNA methylase IME4